MTTILYIQKLHENCDVSFNSTQGISDEKKRNEATEH